MYMGKSGDLLLLPLNPCRTGSHRVGLIGQTQAVLEKQVSSHEESARRQGRLTLLISRSLPPLPPWSKWFLSLRASCFPIFSFPDLSVFSQLFQVLIGGQLRKDRPSPKFRFYCFLSVVAPIFLWWKPSINKMGRLYHSFISECDVIVTLGSESRIARTIQTKRFQVKLLNLRIKCYEKRIYTVAGEEPCILLQA